MLFNVHQCRCSCCQRVGGRRAGKAKKATFVCKLLALASYSHFMRMNLVTYCQLVDIIAPRVSKKPTVMKMPISWQYRLGLMLRYLATSKLFRSMEFQLMISCPAISYIVYEVNCCCLESNVI